MLTKKSFGIVGVFVAVLLVFFSAYQIQKLQKTQSIPNPPPAKVAQTPTPETSATALEYKNTDYGFTFDLPLSWQGYSIVVENWEGNSVDNSAEKFSGPKILIRNPLWTAAKPYQDIPILILAHSQWDLIQQEKLAIGAAPIPPSKLGENDRYVFALPARYNFAFPAAFEEVQKIIDSKPLSAF